MEFEIAKYLFSIYHNRNKDVQLSTIVAFSWEKLFTFFFQLKEITKTFMSTGKLIYHYARRNTNLKLKTRKPFFSHNFLLHLYILVHQWYNVCVGRYFLFYVYRNSCPTNANWLFGKDMSYWPVISFFDWRNFRYSVSDCSD